MVHNKQHHPTDFTRRIHRKNERRTKEHLLFGRWKQGIDPILSTDLEISQRRVWSHFGWWSSRRKYLPPLQGLQDLQDCQCGQKWFQGTIQERCIEKGSQVSHQNVSAFDWLRAKGTQIIHQGRQNLDQTRRPTSCHCCRYDERLPQQRKNWSRFIHALPSQVPQGKEHSWTQPTRPNHSRT